MKDITRLNQEIDRLRKEFNGFLDHMIESDTRPNSLAGSS